MREFMGIPFSDDVEYTGESNRGMQEEDIAGAVGALAQLKKGLGLMKAGKGAFQHVAPVDSSQLGILATATVNSPVTNPAAWPANGYLITGQQPTYKPFKPMRCTVSEQLLVTFTNSVGATATGLASVPDASDLVLVQASCGADNAFPYMPNLSNGIPCESLQSTAIGAGISWPLLQMAVPMVVGFGLLPSALYRVTPPAGYALTDITAITVLAKVALFGPKKR